MGKSVLQRVRLTVQDGGHVCWGEIPPFVTRPEILIWGERFFRAFGEDADDKGNFLVYREAFTVVLTRADLGPIRRD